MIIQISAGQGPSECQLAVMKLFQALKSEYELQNKRRAMEQMQEKLSPLRQEHQAR